MNLVAQIYLEDLAAFFASERFLLDFCFSRDGWRSGEAILCMILRMFFWWARESGLFLAVEAALAGAGCLLVCLVWSLSCLVPWSERKLLRSIDV